MEKRRREGSRRKVRGCSTNACGASGHNQWLLLHLLCGF
jgi:hypothetical protein